MDSRQDFPLRARTVACALGTVTVEMQRTRVEHPAAVYPHNWRALLRGPKDDIMAAASGRAWVPARPCSSYVFLSTADEVSDVSIMQVRALIDQFPDRFGTLLNTGLAFLSQWERHRMAPKGAGLAVLQAGLTELKKSLPKITALAVDLRPAQFIDWDLPNEPAAITGAKQDAREKLQLLSDTAVPERILGERGERFHMLQRHDEHDPHHALLLLGEANERVRGGNNG